MNSLPVIDIDALARDLQEGFEVGTFILFPKNFCGVVGGHALTYFSSLGFTSDQINCKAVDGVIREQITFGQIILDAESCARKMAIALSQAWSNGDIVKTLPKD